MRVTGGDARGIPLKTGNSALVRPATDRLREGVFSSLGSRPVNTRFFDLFAGSGAYGLEAWSRGAAGGIFIERNRTMTLTIKQNVDAVARSLSRPTQSIQVVAADAIRWKPAPDDRAGLIFVDPPYDIISTVAPGLFAKFLDWLAPDGVIVFEMPGGTEVNPPGWECFRRLGKGRHQPSCCFYRPAP